MYNATYMESAYNSLHTYIIAQPTNLIYLHGYMHAQFSNKSIIIVIWKKNRAKKTDLIIVSEWFTVFYRTRDIVITGESHYVHISIMK